MDSTGRSLILTVIDDLSVTQVEKESDGISGIENFSAKRPSALGHRVPASGLVSRSFVAPP